MELASRVFDVVTNPDAVTDQVKELLPELKDRDAMRYWRRVLRMAALCHDIGHLPFSHTSEDLLPQGWSHERITATIIQSKDMREIWESVTPPLRADDIVKLAIGPRVGAKIGVKEFSDWEAILAEIIVGDAFGVDRMDCLLRDSYHAGVAYGRFDHCRLIDTLRILPPPPMRKPESVEDRKDERVEAEDSKEVALGTEEGGLHSSESMLLARYFMFMQVYSHPVRCIYDIFGGLEGLWRRRVLWFLLRLCPIPMVLVALKIFKRLWSSYSRPGFLPNSNTIVVDVMWSATMILIVLTTALLILSVTGFSCLLPSGHRKRLP